MRCRAYRYLSPTVNFNISTRTNPTDTTAAAGDIGIIAGGFAETVVKEFIIITVSATPPPRPTVPAHGITLGGDYITLVGDYLTGGAMQ